MLKNIIFLWQSVDIGPRKMSGKENHYKPHYFRSRFCDDMYCLYRLSYIAVMQMRVFRGWNFVLY